MSADSPIGRHLTIMDPAKRARAAGVSYKLSPEVLAANMVLAFDRADVRAHPFFGMRSQLLKHAWETRQRIFAVTSAEPGNGKTHIATNLAAAISRIAPTVLVELDLRRPSITDRLGLPGYNPGIDDFLSGDVSLAESAIGVRGYDLAIHAVGRARNAPERLLASPRLEQFFEEIRAREEQPICLVDAPPALIDDIMLVKRVVDGAIMVVEEGRTSKRALLSAMKALSPTPVICAVLNKSLWNPNAGVGHGYYGPGEKRIAAGDAS
ncbi:MAG: CpsD/CapB family tyrosine-protein kinase [Sphingomonas sp.]|uniref:CpsD/CapB family tyrosine-protein kinase n=1 Tax=Sphingomonas sp. TaxID=28214 RepID=UPI001B054078|nr:CpsD/CapB family tyrosine-protein kinase [Sphingomonas sp.]MBO9623899.1 CpsD/CapB family tyrosine-protein kinase [Sphingomonas sp.]